MSKNNTLETGNITLDIIFSNYYRDYCFEDVIGENNFLINSETIKAVFKVIRTLKEPPSVLEILLQVVTFDMFHGRDINNECKIAIPS